MKMNFKNFKLNTKFIDIFCYSFCAIYLLFVFLFAYSISSKQNKIENEINNMLLYASSVNKKIEDNKFFNTTEKEEIISTEPLYTDGKTAIIDAYNKTLNSNSFYGEAIGTMTTSTAGMTVKVSSYTQVIKYNQTTFYDNRANKLIETNASSLFMDMINELSNAGVKCYKSNGQIRRMETSKVYFENNMPKADFSGASVEFNADVPIMAESLYIINEETVKEITYFKIKYKKGAPYEYYVQAVLDPHKATERYKEILKQGASLEKYPVFNSVVATVIINAQGYVTSVNAIDKSTIEKMGMDCPCHMIQTYTISGINEEMTYFDEDFV